MWPACSICQHNKKIIADKLNHSPASPPPLLTPQVCECPLLARPPTHLPAIRIKIFAPCTLRTPLLHRSGIHTAPASPLATVCTPDLQAQHCSSVHTAPTSPLTNACGSSFMGAGFLPPAPFVHVPLRTGAMCAWPPCHTLPCLHIGCP